MAGMTSPVRDSIGMTIDAIHVVTVLVGGDHGCFSLLVDVKVTFRYNTVVFQISYEKRRRYLSEGGGNTRCTMKTGFIANSF